MKVRCVKSDSFSLSVGKIYDVLSVENNWYRIVDDSEEDYLYPPTLFMLVGNDEDNCKTWIKKNTNRPMMAQCISDRHSDLVKGAFYQVQAFEYQGFKMFRIWNNKEDEGYFYSSEIFEIIK